MLFHRLGHFRKVQISWLGAYKNPPEEVNLCSRNGRRRLVQIWNESVVEGQLFLDVATISGDLRCDKSVFIVSLIGTTIDGNIECSACAFSAPFDSEAPLEKRSYALNASFCKVPGTISMSDLIANGGINLAYARIGGIYDAYDALLRAIG